MLKSNYTVTLFWLLALPWQRFAMSLMRWALKLMTGEEEEESAPALKEKFCAELKMFLLAFPMACTCSSSSARKQGSKKDTV